MGLKERTQRITRPYKQKTVNVLTGVVTSENDDVDYVNLYESRLGIEQPFHRQMIANRQGATSNLTASRESCVFSSGSITVTERDQIKFPPQSPEWRDRYVSTSTKMAWTFSQVTPRSVVGSAVSDARADALSKYYQKVNEIRQSAKGQVMAGEIRETIRMLRNPFQGFIKLFTSLMRNNSTWRSPVRAQSELWLQYRFGILPLIQDCEDIKKIINKTAVKEHVGSSRVYGVSQSAETEVWTGSDIYGATLQGTMTYEQKAEVIIRFGYLYQAMGASAAKTDDFMESFLNPRDLPSTAWELIPWSFLVDYFVNIGAIIESVTTYTGAVVWTSDSTVKTSTATLAISNYKSLDKNLYVVSNFSPSLCKRTKRSVERTTAPPGIPPLTFELPGSNIRLANIAALLGGLLKGK
jgi:hypothetical protein